MLTIELKKPLDINWLTIQRKFHRHHQPVHTSWWEPGKLQYKSYWVNGKHHRDPTKGPAYQSWYETGQLQYKIYQVNGELHRDPSLGPAPTFVHEDGC